MSKKKRDNRGKDADSHNEKKHDARAKHGKAEKHGKKGKAGKGGGHERHAGHGKPKQQDGAGQQGEESRKLAEASQQEHGSVVAASAALGLLGSVGAAAEVGACTPVEGSLDQAVADGAAGVAAGEAAAVAAGTAPVPSHAQEPASSLAPSASGRPLGTDAQSSVRKIMYEPIREYRLKFYLNAQHYVVFNGKRGETHPHTWEFTLTVEVSGLELTPFSAFEQGIESYLAPFQNKVLNGLEPFDTMLPTLENLVEEFVGPFGDVIEGAGGRLAALEGSEGPTRSYIVRERHEARAEFERQDLRAEQARVIDGIVGEALE